MPSLIGRIHMPLSEQEESSVSDTSGSRSQEPQLILIRMLGDCLRYAKKQQLEDQIGAVRDAFGVCLAIMGVERLNQCPVEEAPSVLPDPESLSKKAT